MKILSLGLLSLVSFALAACSGAATTAEPAADLVVAGPLRERCDKSSGGDAAKSKDCMFEIATQAAKEKIRFSRDNAGHTVWTSFEADGGKEVVYAQVPVELAADGPGRVLAKVAGAPSGEMAEKFTQSSTNQMRIEVVDARTIAMTDPKKGRLVYAKE